ncbi:MAG: hydroxymethylglutaryl-CoA reductase, degradative, partial [Gammaproteobacteria bacterium]|nr:hydroxymethylglutaryl-CoA reductase, degradative [Gammaproteobacteria bacterium]
MKSSRIKGLHQLPIADRISTLAERGFLDPGSARLLSLGKPLLPPQTADRMIENVIGVFGLPFGVAPNFIVNDKEYLVPLVVEEPSVVAAVSGAAKLVRDSDGFKAKSMDPVLIGQVQIVGIEDPDKAVQALFARQVELIALANSFHPNLMERGGGARDIEYFKYRLPDGDWTVVLHLLVDTRDAMGANIVNTMCEGVGPRVEEICGGNVVLRILSNLADKSLVTATASIALSSLATADFSAEFVRDGIVLANDFAIADPYRAATHNKGIMNGIDALAIATGNDWRAIEAGVHAFAARGSAYRALTSWTVAQNGDLQGALTVPLKVGIVGGALTSNPGASIGLQITGVESATELGELMAATGLAQNLAALRALVTTGIQEGHMRLHARSVAAAASVPAAKFDAVVESMIESGEVKTWKAQQLVDEATEVIDEHAATGQACGKVILLGEHAAVYDRHALALPIDGAVTVQVAKRDAGVRLLIPGWQIDDDWSPGDSVPDGAAAVVGLVMEELGVGNGGFDVRAQSRIPIGMGLGSSAAFAVAVIRAFNELLGRQMTDTHVDRLAFRCEELTHGTPSGIDNNLAVFGQPVLYSKGSRTRTRPIRLSETPRW